MRAIVYNRFGLSDRLHLEEVSKPIPKGGEVLVKVRSVSINDWDWALLRGKPFVNRLPRILVPKYKILGSDVAGTIEAVGPKATIFKPGDEVLGDLSGNDWGGFAEYVCTREDALLLKPAAMSFDQAAAMPQAGVLGLQGVRDKTQIQPGQKVLVNGAGGGAGSFALQLAKLDGAEVTAVDRAEKLDLMRSLGADRVVDYTSEDFTKNGQLYDVIIDMAMHRSLFDYKRVLTPNGRYIVEGGADLRIMQAVFVGGLISLYSSKKMGLLLHKKNKGLDQLLELFEAGKIKPIIDKRYPLRETSEAMRYFGERHAKGKVIITI